ncbi:endonuclease/exonuclease/phosphatase family protein [Actinospongicola halichondriae]|uniref:endonuclease/exonuclease/phosphatase family protein n=1 Tax=Actinospongicola halichondriae TaxID=3236844 RepID=UPI003D49D5A6
MRLVTWNLQGSARPDLAAVASTIAASGASVVLVQEIQRRQAKRLARLLGWSVTWRFKHWSIAVPPEGLAILSPEPQRDVRRVVLALPWSFWSWRRRIAVSATIPGSPTVRVVNTHLGAGVDDAERARQAELTIEMTGVATGTDPASDVSGPAVVAGDLNTKPGSVVLRVYEDAGLVDAWMAARGDAPGATNWSPGPRVEPPTKRLDYVFATPDLSVLDATVPSAEDAVERFGPISDHLPLTVSFDVLG